MAIAIGLSMVLAGGVWMAEPALRPVHTYSIVARDPGTGELGIAVPSHWFSVGSNVVWAEAVVGAAGEMFPENAEMVFWHAVALVNMRRLEDSLPLFRRVFAMDSNWATLTPRLPRSGILPDDASTIERILAQSKSR